MVTMTVNLCSTINLDSHLIEGLNPAGVPQGLADTVIPMNFNCFDDLEKIRKLDNVAAVKIEVARSRMSSVEYLLELREMCDEKGIVLIFDECTSGFREAYGGIFNLLGVNPDMAMLARQWGMATQLLQ